MHGQTSQNLVSLLLERLLSLLHDVVVADVGHQGVIIHLVRLLPEVGTRSLLLSRLLPRQLDVEMVIVNLVAFKKLSIFHFWAKSD